MALSVQTNQPRSGLGDIALGVETLSGPGSTGNIRLTGDITVQITGTATNIVAMFERNPQDPAIFPGGWAPAEDDTFSGSLVTGIPVRAYFDPLSAFYRVRFTTLSGGNATVAITGEQA